MTIIEKTVKEFSAKLDANSIPYTFRKWWDGGRWFFPDFDHGDIVAFSSSYGINKGYVESMGMPWDGKGVSACSVDEMISRLLDNKPTMN